MTLRVIEHAGLSDVGRQREANEDSLVLASPVFAVADGMGGARAGEVASEIAASAFRERPTAAGTPEQQLTEVALRANARIYELAQRDDSRRGMGTTLTAAIVTDGAVSVGHVGDSRAYRLREGRLEQLTRDHSLVAELQRSGQLTPEAAEQHPQRSIITRALGPEPEVEVDTHTHPARAGDVYVLCSDGLTGMVSDDDLAAILTAAPTLRQAAEDLVRAANQRGGKDNITVVLFRLGDGGEGDGGDDDATADERTIHRGLTVEDVDAAVAEQERAGALPTDRPRRRRPAPAAPPARSLGRRALTWLLALAVVAAVALGAWLGARQVYFLGTDDAGVVAIYRGLPYELPFDVELYSEQYASGVPAAAIPEARRGRVLDHQWRSRSDAEDLVRQLELGTLDPGRQPR